jgi:hypothetical protein
MPPARTRAESGALQFAPPNWRHYLPCQNWRLRFATACSNYYT